MNDVGARTCVRVRVVAVVVSFLRPIQRHEVLSKGLVVAEIRKGQIEMQVSVEAAARLATLALPLGGTD